jgi:hypothetical protein
VAAKEGGEEDAGEAEQLAAGAGRGRDRDGFDRGGLFGVGGVFDVSCL